MSKDSYIDYEGAFYTIEQCEKVREKFNTTIHGQVFVIHPKVFNPDIFQSAKTFAPLWTKLITETKPKRVLEVGAGAGYNAILAVLNGAEHVTCTDISKSACENAKENVENYHMEKQVRVLHGDVFSPLSASDKFDLIYWNIPFLQIDIPVEELNDLQRTIFDPDYKSAEKYLSAVRDYLQPHSGRAYIGFSPTIGCYNKLSRIAATYNWELEIFDKEATSEQNVKDNHYFWIYELIEKN